MDWPRILLTAVFYPGSRSAKVPSIKFGRLFIFVPMILYRAVSADEYKDYIVDEKFRLGDNTLEAKQFLRL
jgi:hypothetical protein